MRSSVAVQRGSDLAAMGDAATRWRRRAGNEEEDDDDEEEDGRGLEAWERAYADERSWEDLQEDESALLRPIDTKTVELLDQIGEIHWVVAAGDRCVRSDPMENGEESLVNPEKLDDDEEVLRFLDSLDTYLKLTDSVSSILRQGWFELASARHSMGSSRVSNVVLDQKVQPAATTLQVRESVSELQPKFSLSKWSSSSKDGICSEEIELSSMQTTIKDSDLRHRGTSSLYDDMKKINSTINLTPATSDNNIQKGRSKMLSVFGTLVSPKLRAAQVSFETALDGIVEIANVQSTLLSSFSRLKQERNDSS